MLVLKDSIYKAKNISGFGDKIEFSSKINNPKTFETEKNSIWFLITLPDSGIFTFDIISDNPKSDWDFLMFNYKNIFCKRIDAHKIEPIRSNLSRSANTGLSFSSSQELVGEGVNDSYSKYVTANKGEQLVLVINNPKKSHQGFTLKLHFPNPRPTKKVVKWDTTKTTSTILFELFIKSKSTKQLIPADATIEGIDKRPIYLKAITKYETNLTKSNKNVKINVVAEGYMIIDKELKISSKENQLSEEIYLEKIEVGQRVNLKRIQFYGNQDKFLPSAKPSLQSLLNFMQLNKSAKIEIEGHANGPGKINSKEFKELSKNRAKAVKKYLTENGIAQNRITFIGYGNSKMLFPNAKNLEEMSANRRVEVKITAP